MAYKSIGSYGIIGDMRTCALIGLDGAIDWFCSPRFDSPSMFAAILDDEKGGFFSVSIDEDEYASRQFYWPDTNVLVTRMLGSSGSIELIDFMPVPGAGGISNTRQIVRRVRCARGEVEVSIRCAPAFNYARDAHEIETSEKGVVFRSGETRVSLGSSHPWEVEDGAAVSTFKLKQGEEAVIVLSHHESNDPHDHPVHLPFEEAEDLFRRTVEFWRHWIEQSSYRGRWREMVRRSALVLKLLTYEPTGAIIASPTCSLPETLGGERNWDYRYTWVRDAAFTVYALLRLGLRTEAANFMNFLKGVCPNENHDRPLSVLYNIDGEPTFEEDTLDHLSGYADSKPVRIGNAAGGQLQLDIYGELLDAAYLFNKWGEPVSHEFWLSLRAIVDWVCEHWAQPDEGVWEVRGERRRFTFSRVMCWVAVDRGIRLARKRSFPADIDVWMQTRDRIYNEIMDKGWSEELGAFRMYEGGEQLDAANTIMPLVFFVGPTDPRMLSTLDRTLLPPSEGGLTIDGLVHRYSPDKNLDGMEGEEGTFNMCTFWLIEALTRAGRFDAHRLDEARLMFERMLTYSNHLGLYSEETSVKGEPLGNFPQAFTHLALISAAFNLNRAFGGDPA